MCSRALIKSELKGSKMSHAKQRKNCDKQLDGVDEAEVPTPSTEPDSTNSSEESIAEIDEDFTTFASSSDSGHSFVSSLSSGFDLYVLTLTETQLSSVKPNSSNAAKSNPSTTSLFNVCQDREEKENVLFVRYACQISKL
jgi:hypothetical protein